MNKKFEREFNSYREELSLYLRSNNITLAEYAETLGEEYISPILYPKDAFELDRAKKSFDMFKAINDSKQNFNYDSEENLIFAIYQTIIEETLGKRNYKDLENSMYIIFSDSKLRGKLRVDMITFCNSKSADKELLTMITDGCTNQRNVYTLMDKVGTVLDSLFDKAISRVLIEKPELHDYLMPNSRINGMQSYINSYQDIYNYIISEKLNIPPYEKKLN